MPTKLENLFFTVNFNYIKFSNAGIEMIDDYIYEGVNSKKISLDFGIFYNFPKIFKIKKNYENDFQEKDYL